VARISHAARPVAQPPATKHSQSSNHRQLCQFILSTIKLCRNNKQPSSVVSQLTAADRINHKIRCKHQNVNRPMYYYNSSSLVDLYDKKVLKNHGNVSGASALRDI